MTDLWMDVDVALSEVPVNLLPLLDDGDFKTREESVVYNQGGLDLVWNFVTTGGAMSQTAVTPTESAGDYDWSNQGNGMYAIEIPASGGGSINNDTEGFGWFTGFATGILPWRGPVIGFRAAGLNNLLIDSAHSATRGLAGTALPDAAADAAGGLPISDAGALDLDNLDSNVQDTLSDVMSLNDTKIPDTLSLANINAQVDSAIETYNLDHLLAAAVTGTDVVDNSVVAQLASGDATADWDSYDNTSDSLQATAAAVALVALDVDDVLVDTAEIGAAGAGLTEAGGTGDQLTAVPWNASWDAEVQSEVQDAIEANHLDHLLAADYDPASKPGTSTALLNELVENDGGVSRFTTNALEQGPGGGTPPQVLVDTTIASVTTQTSFTLTAGSDQDDAYNGQSIVLYDASNSDFPCVRRVMDYTGSTKRITLDMAPNFTIVSPDEVKIFVSGAFASVKGATEATAITVDDGVSAVEGAEVWITTGAAGTVTVWNGVTDSSGNPKDVNNENPFLDPGTYYVWVQDGRYSFSNPTSMVVTTTAATTTISGTAVSAPGSVAMSALIDAVQVDLADSAASVYAEADLLQWLNDAIRDYSVYWPRRRTGTISAVEDDRKYDLPEDFLRVVNVEYPTGSDPVDYLERRDTVDAEFWVNDGYYYILRRGDQEDADEIWISTSPGSTPGTITLEYLAYHPHDLATGEFCTVPIEDHYLLRLYVAWRATVWLQVQEQASPTSNSSLLMSMLAQNANQQRAQYLELLGQHRMFEREGG